MAGRKQHFIPQALQKGFGVIVGKATRVYVFKKGQPSYCSSTVGVAAQRDFYSVPSDEQSLDDKITMYEGAVLAPAIAALRQASAGPIDSNMVAAVVVHLAFRSAFIRDSWSVITSEILDSFMDAMRNGEATARSLLEVDTLNPDSTLVKLIEEDLISRFGTFHDSSKKALAKLAHFRVREVLPYVFPTLSRLALTNFQTLHKKIPEITVNAHNKALERDLTFTTRVEHLKTMNWQIIVADPPTHFVLPDCLAIGSRTSDFRNVEPYSLQNDSELAIVVMPICANKVLVGSFENQKIDIPSLNRSFAECSLDFFISSQSDTQTTEIAQFIGSGVSKCIGSVTQDDRFTAPTHNRNEEEEQKVNPKEQIKIPIQFHPSSRKSGKAKAIVRNLMNLPELQQGLRIVETIVIADNIAHALHQRGIALNDYMAQIVRSGTCHLTETSDRVSCQLFVTSESVNLVAKGHPFARPAATFIRHQAGRATYYATIFTQLSKDALQRQRPLLETIELRIVHFFCSHYFGGRFSWIEPISEKEFVAIDSGYSTIFSSVMQGITNARLHFIQYRNVDAALIQAIAYVEQLLCAVATTCAITDGEIERWKSSKSMNALQAVGLGRWFELFAYDLNRLFDAREQLTVDDELILLGSHIERVLWSFGIVLSQQPDGQIWMEVLTDERLQVLRTSFQL